MVQACVVLPAVYFIKLSVLLHFIPFHYVFIPVCSLCLHSL